MQKLEVFLRLGVGAGSIVTLWCLGGEAGSTAASQEEKLEVLLRLGRRSWKYSAS